MKPDLDRRSYRFVVLPNGLQVLLASDPDADTAAASMSIKAGSFQDPPEFMGLAHFHEHMLFLGTEKYPDESEYEKFLKDHGGYSNAYTADELTNYYFRVNAPHLNGALDRFSQFFIAPTFDPSSVDREMSAVDSESTNYAADEGWRRIQVLKSTAQPGHPFHRFSVGNNGTLGYAGPEKVRDVLVRWNHAHYHAGIMRLAIAGRESLDELEGLARLLFGAVRALPEEADGAAAVGADAVAPAAAPPGALPVTAEGEAWQEQQLGSYLEVVPKIEERSVGVYWPLPSAQKHLYGKIENYISHICGHEGRGSLHELLNQEGLLESLSSGPQVSFTGQQLFGIEVSLTLEGERRLPYVLERIFAYVALLRETGPRVQTFNELRLLNEVGFRFAEESPAPENFAASATSSMHFYPPHDTLRGPRAMDEWLPDTLAEWLRQMVPKNCFLIRVSPDFQDRLSAVTEGLDDGEEGLPNSDALETLAGATTPEGAWLRERWYGARFRRRALTPEEVAAWSEPSAEAREGLAMPADNPFVPSDFSLRCEAPGAPAEVANAKRPMTALEVTPPTEVARAAAAAAAGGGDLLRIWHKTDGVFRVPKVSFNAHIMTPVYEMGPAPVVAMRLFCNILGDDLNAYSYDASMAGLAYNVDFGDRLTFSVGGFNHRLPELLTKVAERLRSLLGELTAVASDGAEAEARAYWVDRVEKQREILLRAYENFWREDPIQVADYNMRQVLLKNVWHLSEYMDVLREHSGESFLKPLTEHVTAALSRIRVEVFSHGNIREDESVALAETLRRSLVGLGSSAEEDCTLAEDQMPQNTVVVMEPNVNHTVVCNFDIEATNPVEENGAILNVYQTGPFGEDPHRDACMAMVAQLVDASAFAQLRTKEQLGYIVSAGYHRLYEVDGLSVMIQGPRLPPAALDERIEAWLVQFREEFEELTEEVFATNVRSVVELKMERDKQMGQEAGRLWTEIVQRTYRFDRVKREIAALEALTKADVVAFFDEHLAAAGPKRRKLSSRVYGGASRTEEQRKQDAEALETSEGLRILGGLEEVRAFKADLPTHSIG